MLISMLAHFAIVPVVGFLILIPALVIIPPFTTTKFIDVINSLGLSSGLQVALDAGDSNSYSGSGQTWTDLSGNGYSFFRGAGSGSGSDDPTFNGNAGSQSSNEYFGVNGSQYFTLNQTNPTWVNSIHKAGAKFTIVEWVYVNSASSTSIGFGTVADFDTSSTSGVGFAFGSSSSQLRSVAIDITNSATTSAYGKISSAAANNNAWNLLAVSVDITSGNVIFQINGTSESYTSQSYSSPSSAAAISTLQVSAFGGGEFPDSNGMRWGSLGMWNTGLTAAQLTAIFNNTRAKYGV